MIRKYLSFSLIDLGVIFVCAINGFGQTTLMTKAEWTVVMTDVAPTPFKLPAPPYRMTVRQSSFEDGDLLLGYTSLIVSEHFSRTNSRFTLRERIGTKTRSDEKVYIGKQIFSSRDDGPWVVADLPSRTLVVRSQPDPVNPSFIRKPNSNEVLFYSLGVRPHKGQTVSVYEEVTRHVLIRTAHKTEVHYENRTRIWIASDKTCVRWDTYYAIFDSTKTHRMFTSHEWELNPDMKPFGPPIQQSN